MARAGTTAASSSKQQAASSSKRQQAAASGKQQQAAASGKQQQRTIREFVTVVKDRHNGGEVVLRLAGECSLHNQPGRLLDLPQAEGRVTGPSWQQAAQLSVNRLVRSCL